MNDNHVILVADQWQVTLYVETGITVAQLRSHAHVVAEALAATLQHLNRELPGIRLTLSQ